MQIFSKGDNLHEILNPVFWESKKNITNLSSAELAQRTVKVIGWIFEKVKNIHVHEYMMLSWFAL